MGSPTFLDAATRAGRLVAPDVFDALGRFADHGVPAGALLIRGLPIGRIGPTPESPAAPTEKDQLSEFVLLTLARRLGQPVGYAPEHGGRIVQNLLPTRADAARQTSTSSGVDLAFHTETAFHPHKPRYLALLCLRGEPEAATLLTSVTEVCARLTDREIETLRQPRFITRADESFLRSRATDDRDGVTLPRLTEPMAVLAGTEVEPSLTFDADLMVGLDAEATAALDAVRAVVAEHHLGVALAAGDLLVIDNAVAVHGRSSFPARFDGTDRWLQRTFVVSDLTASADQRRGRVITTRFA
jgi:L-asparagine oxygenase